MFDPHERRSGGALAVSHAEHWGAVADGVFASAPYRALPDPLGRLLGYVDFRKAILQGELSEFTCLVGTMVQEAYETYPRIREACNKSISEHAAMVEADIAEAMREKGIDAEWSAESLALYTQAVIQGADAL